MSDEYLRKLERKLAAADDDVVYRKLFLANRRAGVAVDARETVSERLRDEIRVAT